MKLKHYAHDRGETESAISLIVEPEEIYSLTAKGGCPNPTTKKQRELKRVLLSLSFVCLPYQAAPRNLCLDITVKSARREVLFFRLMGHFKNGTTVTRNATPNE